MTAHTPGPWAIRVGWPTVIVSAGDQLKGRGAAESESVDAQYAQAIAIAHDDDFARTGWPHRITREQSKANAQLIAAAPELYDALSGLLSVLDEYVGWRNTAAHEPRETAAENRARAALAKARGETP